LENWPIVSQVEIHAICPLWKGANLGHDITKSNHRNRRSAYSGAALLAFVIVGTTYASAQPYEFQYLETEKVYNTTIRDLMAKEYYAARQQLKLKADSLGMEIRKIDITRLQELLRNRSFLYATCFDRAIRVKSDNPKISQEKYSLDCAKEGLKIIDAIDRGALGEWGIPALDSMGESYFNLCQGEGKVYGVRTFDFLIDEDELPNINKDKINLYTVVVTDYYRVKKCIVEKLRR
jgi:hypothetical protein